MRKRFLAALALLPMLAGSSPGAPVLTIDTNTFSLVVVDPRAREVAVAGASCVPDVSIIGSTIQNVGAAATQASFSSTNRTRVEQRLQAGDSPTQVIAFVTNPSRDPNFARRQYGVATLAHGAAGFTGGQTSPANGHRVGPFLTAQGNLLVQAAVLDSIRSSYINQPDVPLITRMLLALEAGQDAGGDARCSHGADSAFVRIRRAEDAGTSYANLVITNPSSGPNPNDPIAQLRTSVNSWRAQRAGTVDRWNSTVSIFPARIPANGTATATVTVTLRDPGGTGLAGRAVSASGQGRGTVSAFADRGGGVYTATVRSASVGTETFTVQSGGAALGDTARASYETPRVRQALFVTGSLTLGAGDSAIAGLLGQLGFGVVLRTAPAVAAADAAGKQLVVVSSTITSGDLGGRLNGVAQPILNLEPFVGAAMGLNGGASTSFGTVAAQRQFSMRATPIVDGTPLAPGLRPVLSQGEEIGFSVPGSAAEVVAATATNESRPVAYVYDTGDTLANGTTAAGPRAFLGLRNDTARSLTASGRTLLEALVIRLT
jgi:uncharacterized Ntn-hydrolase superfamily protein